MAGSNPPSIVRHDVHTPLSMEAEMTGKVGQLRRAVLYSITLRSPSGKFFRIEVTDAGALTVSPVTRTYPT